VTLTLYTPFSMAGFQSGSCIDIETAHTAITIVGNGAVFDAGGKDRFFTVGQAVTLVMSNVTLQNGTLGGDYGGAIFVTNGGTITLNDCSFRGNTASGGGAIFVTSASTIAVASTVTLNDCSFCGNTAVHQGNGGAILVGYGTAILNDCSFRGNTAQDQGCSGGALDFASGTNGLLKNCSLLGTVSPKNNDIARRTTANVTFACADGEVGTPVQMSGTEITKLPAPTCTTRYIASWNTLSSSITAAAGKVVTLTLSTPFDMTGFSSFIDMKTAKTAITIVGNAAVFDAGGKDRFFYVDRAVALVMSNVTLQNGYHYGGGAISVDSGGTITLSECTFTRNTASNDVGGAMFVNGGTITLSDCSFNENTAFIGGAMFAYGTITLSDCSFNGNAAGNGIGGSGGAITVSGTITLSDCSFNGNTATDTRGEGGGALYFRSNTNGLLKNCSLLGTVSPKNNDISRDDTTANVTFGCADGEVGTPVQMSGTAITKLPVLTCTAQTYYCYNGGKANWKCVPGIGSVATLAQCQEVCAP
jgi:predicted outer membrane repeat protein